MRQRGPKPDVVHALDPAQRAELDRAIIKDILNACDLLQLTTVEPDELSGEAEEYGTL